VQKDDDGDDDEKEVVLLSFLVLQEFLEVVVVVLVLLGDSLHIIVVESSGIGLCSRQVERILFTNIFRLLTCTEDH
jgi:hypothetical protein